MTETPAKHVDVVVVGAGISGIGAAYYLGARCKDRSYLVLEGRENLGGTWDLFRYPGIRSDSDMHTLGFRFRPWIDDKAVADGPSILKYLRETTEEYGIDKHIRFQHMVKKASWDSETNLWTVEALRKDTGETVRITCNFLFMCSGYYNYEQGYTPEFEGMDQFQGEIVHPQKWGPGIEHAGKRVVVIGSGATAVTLVPAMAKDAAHVTMLQRSPTYYMVLPWEDALANAMRDHLPGKLAYFFTRWKKILLFMFFFQFSRRAPAFMKRQLIEGVRKELGEQFDEAAFTPDYNPWDQRICFVPDGDLFEAMKAGDASIVTDHVETFTDKGIRLRSGKELEADMIVTATGLNVMAFGGIDVVVDGEPVVLSTTMGYKAMMLSDVPNLALAFGYTNAAWTLKADLTAEYVCKLLNHMSEYGYRKAVPRREADVTEKPFLDFKSGYVQRALADLPRQGSRAPWRLFQNYILDVMLIRYGRTDDGVMEFR